MGRECGEGGAAEEASASGVHIAVAFGLSGTARVQSLITGEELLRLSQHKVHRVCFSPDGGHLLTGSADATAVLCDSPSGAPVVTYQGHTDRVTGVAFSPAQTHQPVIATASADATARVWPLFGGPVMAVLRGHGSALSSVHFSEGEGPRAVTGSGDCTARVWDWPVGRELLILRHHDEVYSVQFSPDSTKVLSGCNVRTTKAVLWDLRSGQREMTLLSHKSGVNRAVFADSSGQRVVTASMDRTARVWDLRRCSGPLHTFRGHTDAVLCCGVTGEVAASGGW
eukprot:RCo034458